MAKEAVTPQNLGEKLWQATPHPLGPPFSSHCSPKLLPRLPGAWFTFCRGAAHSMCGMGTAGESPGLRRAHPESPKSWELTPME